eukprot:scaffold2122_cov69-Phaeocystis_antarctica.AAC.2
MGHKEAAGSFPPTAPVARVHALECTWSCTKIHIGDCGALSSPASPPSSRASRRRAPGAPAVGCARQQRRASVDRAASRCCRRWLAVARQRASRQWRASRHRLSACRSLVWLVPNGVRSSAAARLLKVS